MDPKTVDKAYISSSNGTVTIDAMTGVVLEVDILDDCELPDITHFDLDEYYQTYPEENREDVRNYDILDLGYTYVSETGVPCYEYPAHDWRDEYAKERHNPDPETELLTLFSR